MKRNWVVQRRIVALCEGYLIVCLFRLFRIVPSNMVIVLGEQFVFELKHRIDNLLVKLERLLGITQDFLWDIYTSDELLITRDSCGLNKIWDPYARKTTFKSMLTFVNVVHRFFVLFRDVLDSNGWINFAS